MNDHRVALVPIEAWEYHSPLLRVAGKQSDLGLLAEALVYYDKVIADVPTRYQLEELVRWSVLRGHPRDLLELVNSGVLEFHIHGFRDIALRHEQGYTVMRMVEAPEPEKSLESPPEFHVERLLRSSDLSMLHARHAKAILEAIRKHITVANADDYQIPTEAARDPLRDSDKAAALLQAFVDEVFEHYLHQAPPKVECTIADVDSDRWTITYNMDFRKLNSLLQNRLDFRVDIPMIGQAHTNRNLWTASRLGIDLFLGRVMSDLTRETLAEARDRANKPQQVIDELEITVGLPDIRGQVNHHCMDLQQVLSYRKKAERFRDWVRTISETEKDTALAYYHDSVDISRLPTGTGSVLKLIGVVSSAASVATGIAGAAHETAAALSGTSAAANFLSQIASRFSGEWKPYIYGRWLDQEIRRRNPPYS